MRTLLSYPLFLSLGLSACAKPESPPVTRKVGIVFNRDLDAVAKREVSRVPTLPEGGLIKGKNPALTVEANIARQTANRVAPLSFGQSFAGIDMTTTRDASKAILSEPKFSTDTGIDVFAEGFNLTWNPGINPTPKSVQIFSDYKGALKLPQPYGDVKLEESLASHFMNDAQHIVFTQTLARTFAGKEKELSFDCLAEALCQIEHRGEQTFIDFPSGTLALWGDSIYLVEYIQNQGFAPKSKAPIVFGTSMGGVDINMNKEQVNAALGAPYRYADGETQLYDAKTIRVDFRASGAVEQIVVSAGYQGTMKVGASERGIGTGFADIIANQDDPAGKLMMQALAKILAGKDMDPTFDCLKAEGGAICASGVDKANGIIRVQVGNMIFDFKDDKERTLLSVTMFNPAA